MRRANFIVALLGTITLACGAGPTTAPSSVNLKGATLAEALDSLAASVGANIHVDWKSLEAAGVSRDAVVDSGPRLKNITLRKAITLTLANAGAGDLATFYIDQGVIEITTKEKADAHMVTRIYPVDDLLVDVPDFKGPQFSLENATNQTSGGSGGGGGGGSSGGLFEGSGTDTNSQVKTKTKAERGQDLVDTITSTVRPDIWKVNGGTATIVYLDGKLIVTAPESVQEALGYSHR